MIVEQPVTIDQAAYDRLFVHNTALPRLTNLIQEWSGELRETEARREERYIDLDAEAMRANGELKEDETFIPVRVIDTNICREHPAYSAFITQSRRLVTLICMDNPNLDASRLELEVTRGLKYAGWFKEFFRTFDGALAHGWDAIEVVFDSTKPLHVAFEHVGHDKLYFNQNVKNLQESECLILRKTVTATVLKTFVTSFGFNADQVDLIIKPNEQDLKTDKTYDIYKQFYKFDGVVYVAWFATKDTNDWLRAPEPLRLGISEMNLPAVGPDASAFIQEGTPPAAPSWTDVPIDMYPVFLLPYKENEEDEITAKVGRCYLDGPWQEAQSAVVSGYVNGLLRASNLYAAPDTDSTEEASIKQLDVQLVNGAIYNSPLKFFHADYPEVTTLSSLNYLNSQQASQAGQVDYAAMNRQDSRKTATEISSAQEEANLLKSTPITLYSENLREVFTLAWRIIQSQAIQDKIPLLRIPEMVPIFDPATGQQVGEQPTGRYVNNKSVIALQYLVLPSGDSDVVQRKEKIAQMMQDWPVIQGTPLAPKFLADLIRLKYPDVGDDYAKILTAGDVGKQLVQGLYGALSTLVKSDTAAQTPESAAQFQQLTQQVQAYLQPNQPQRTP